ncbi:hypothetical protein [Mastigocoleus testarum]|uniref:hypothetical protein n=1 Tax=Mastigocoleus testarum TaxID=996925 RepID=UPI00191081F4|nr:hypothetical protein [Mastigocoleus testarum]
MTNYHMPQGRQDAVLMALSTSVTPVIRHACANTHYPLPITHYPLPITNYQLPIT